MRALIRWLWPDPVFLLESGTRVALVGRPGSGKTAFLRWLLATVPSVVVYDTKYDDRDWASDPNFFLVHAVHDLTVVARAVLRVPVSWIHNAAGWKVPGSIGWNWTQALNVPMRRKNTVVVFDEALDTLPPGGAHDGTHRLFQQGRAFGVTVVVGSQLANNISTRVLRLATHLIAFRVLHQTDLEEIKRARSIDCSVLGTLRQYEFAYHHESAHNFRIFYPVNLARRGWLRERAYVPDPITAQSGLVVRAIDRVRHWWRSWKWSRRVWAVTVICGVAFHWFASPLLLVGAFFSAWLGGFLILRAQRARYWRVVVQCGEPELAPELALPPPTTPSGTQGFKRPINRHSSRARVFSRAS